METQLNAAIEAADDDVFTLFLESIQARIATLLHIHQGTVFQTKFADELVHFDGNYDQLTNKGHRRAAGEFFYHMYETLYHMYGTMGPDKCEEYTCSTCRNFLNKYAGLVVLDNETCAMIPLLWDEASAPEPFKPAVRAIVELFKDATIVNPFYMTFDAEIDPDPQSTFIGTPPAGEYKHFYFSMDGLRRRPDVLRSIAENQRTGWYVMRMLQNAIEQYTDRMTAPALELFATDRTLAGYAGSAGTLDLFASVRDKVQAIEDSHLRQNAIWLASRYLPKGVTHIRESALGQFVENMVDGTSMAAAVAAFVAQAVPSNFTEEQIAEDTIRQQEKDQALQTVLEELGLWTAMGRRLAEMRDLPKAEFLWRRKDDEFQRVGLFGVQEVLNPAATAHLEDPLLVDGGTINYSQLLTKLATSSRAWLHAAEQRYYAVGGLLTATDVSSAPLLAYDTTEQRNPVNRYTYNQGAYIYQIGLAPGLVEIQGVIPTPEVWHGRDAGYSIAKAPHFFVLEGAKEQGEVPLCLFEPMLRQDLDADLRARIAEYGRRHRVTPTTVPAAGIWVQPGDGELLLTFVLEDQGVKTRYFVQKAR